MLSKGFSRVVLPALFSLLTAPVFSDSAVRIVRLSYIDNDVQIDRGSGQYEKAMVNLPITAGTKLKTGSRGLAEVEFEDASTIRLAPQSTLQIPQLLLRDSGEKVSTAELVNGTAYVNFVGSTKKIHSTVWPRHRGARSLCPFAHQHGSQPADGCRLQRRHRN